MVFVLLISCSRPEGREEGEASPIEVPPSYLSFRVNFPASELEEGVNDILPERIMDGPLPMKDKGDTLFLKITRKGRLKLSIRKNEIFASIPLEVVAAVSKKVMGVTISNKETPVTFSGTLKASAVVDINEDWDMEMTCAYQEFDLGSSAQVSIMGMTFGIEKSIDKALAEHSDELSDLICGALKGALDFRQTVEKVWMDVQQPQRIAREPRKFWLYSSPIALNGQLIPLERDTLSVHLEYRTSISISPTERSSQQLVPLGKKGQPLNTSAALLAYPEVRVSYQVIEEMLWDEFRGREFTYEGYKIHIKELTVGRKGQKLKVNLTTTGDVEGNVTVLGTPSLDQAGILTLEGFSYTLDEGDEWVRMTDLVVHQFVEGYIADQITIDTRPLLGSLDQRIMEGLQKSQLGAKVDIRLGFKDITSYQMRLTDDLIQWIFYVEGWSEVNLKKGIFQKKPS